VFFFVDSLVSSIEIAPRNTSDSFTISDSVVSHAFFPSQVQNPTATITVTIPYSASITCALAKKAQMTVTQTHKATLTITRVQQASIFVDQQHKATLTIDPVD
jgi:hypothetical protein